MKRFGWLSLIVASLAFSSMGMASSNEVAANCKKVSKSVVRVCNTYNAHKKSLENARNQLNKDRQSIAYVRAHILSVEGVYKTIRDGKGKNRKAVVAKIKAMYKTGDRVLNQMDPLAKRYRVYNNLLRSMVRTKDAFAVQYKRWLKSASDDSDDSDDLDDADDSDDLDDADDSDDLDDADDSDDLDDSDDSDDSDDADDLDDLDDTDDL